MNKQKNANMAAWEVPRIETKVPHRFVQPDSWVGHIPFAFWLVEAVRPASLVELGVHTGNSYCAFAQAIDDLGLESRIFGVDHWMGDPHAGLYGDDVYVELKTYHDPLYGRFSSLLRMSFDEAIGHLPDNSVDILHIDGLHTYDAVRHDFETWLPKMGPRGVVLFHDTNVRQGDFGVWKFWKEIAADRPAFEFLHSNGLGVLYVGSEEPPPALAKFFDAASSAKGCAALRAYFGRLGDPLVAHLLASARAAEVERVLRQVHGEAQKILEEAAALRAEHKALIGREEIARRWDVLALHLAKTTGLSLEEAATGIRRLYNSDDPSALKDRERLTRTLSRLAEGLPIEPSPAESGLAALLGRGASLVARRLLRRPPMRVDPAIEQIRESVLFDETYYALTEDAKAQGKDPLFHYLEVGEEQGVPPSKDFEPAFYARRYPDVRDSGWGLLRHYALFGKNEGREGLSPARRMVLPPIGKRERKPILLVVHDASRTDVSLLAWNLASRLTADRDVVVALTAGGPLEENFRKVATQVVIIPEAATLVGIDLEEVVDRLVDEIDPHFVVLNGIKTRGFARRLAAREVGIVALIHEFSVDVSPKGAFYDMLLWAHHVVFPAQLVCQSFEDDYPFVTQRRRSIIPQGRLESPSEPEDKLGPEHLRWLRPADAEDNFLVIGMGFVQLSKGIDLFISVAAAAVRADPSGRLRFAWVGAGDLSEESSHLSTYLADQIMRSDLKDRFVIIHEAEELNAAIGAADMVVLSSRLDPMPNAAIEALSQGKPVLSFEKASGIAETLSAHPELSRLVVPYLDVGAMGARIVELSHDAVALARLSEAGCQLATQTFDMERYVRQILALGEEAHNEMRVLAEDAAVIEREEAFDVSFYTGVPEAEAGHILREYLVKNQVVRAMPGAIPPAGLLRRPLPGFNPHAFAEFCMQKSDAHDPLARWLLEGRPEGAWSHPVIRLDKSVPAPPENIRVLLHAHFHYTDLLGDFLSRLSANQLKCDLVVTTTSEENAHSARAELEHYIQGKVTVLVVPNRGRDIGPFLTGLADIELASYDVVGHAHGKKSPHMNDGAGTNWREFLWEHLVGGRARAADAAVSAFARDPSLGLVFPEDPYLLGWDANRLIAEELSGRMGIDALPDSFGWPVGTMFWARPQALDPLFSLKLDWVDYPAEPLPGDGTMLHAIERLLPLVAAHAGFHHATTYLPGISR